MDGEVLARIDADARRLGISRTAWLHVAAHEKLKREARVNNGGKVAAACP
jgi:hypothetical protein